jgi:hypothetical protein
MTTAACTTTVHHLPMASESYERPDLCGPCRGKCCQSYPGATSPEDWGAPDVDVMRERLTDGLQSGRWSLDWWQSDDENDNPILWHKIYIPRPAAAGREGQRYYSNDTVFFGIRIPQPCTFWASTGCSLGAAARPRECRMLEPVAPGGVSCKSRGGPLSEIALTWAPWSEVVESVVDGLEIGSEANT